ncbi:hypothetical protein C8F01DRAFT_178543 [Mycena amicta]|nr:hypothetical protein C8F01DRAFT_178543 [Mycena amicta]
MTTNPTLSGPIFKFSRETNAVRVENIPHNVNRLEILSLFSTLIGEIRSSQDLDDALEITFFTGDTARKALCISGYNVAGSKLVVTPIIRSASPALSQGGQQGKRNDMRRNLYVLGIPFGMTNQSLATLFSPHGTVSHCVILATLDGTSRRRGFVVMSTHEEARRAMATLGRNGKGSGLDISWAVVQRSKGFLDGGDRAGVVVPSPASTFGSPPPVFQKPSPADTQALPSLSNAATPVVLLANLPSLLFGAEDDLRGLVCPFGKVKALRLVKMPLSSTFTSAPAPGTTAAVVHYTTLSAAQDACRSLDGESYAGCTLRVVFLADPDAPSVPNSPLLAPPADPAQLGLPRLHSTFAGARCGPPAVKTLFDGRNVCNFISQDGYHLERPMQFPVYSVPSFVQYDAFPGYGELPARWIPTSVYARAPSRDMGYCV